MTPFDRAAVRDDGFVFQIGTLSGNPIAAVAGLETLEILKRPGAYERLFATGEALMRGCAEIVERAGIPAQVIGAPPMFDVVFTTGEVADYRATLRSPAQRHKDFAAALRERGVLKGESKFYVSLAHDARDVAETLDAVAGAIEATAAAAS